jgi:hypothetical protein
MLGINSSQHHPTPAAPPISVVAGPSIRAFLTVIPPGPVAAEAREGRVGVVPLPRRRPRALLQRERKTEPDDASPAHLIVLTEYLHSPSAPRPGWPARLTPWTLVMATLST